MSEASVALAALQMTSNAAASVVVRSRAIELAARICMAPSMELHMNATVAIACAKAFVAWIPRCTWGTKEALVGLAALCGSAEGAGAVVQTRGHFGAKGCNSLYQYLHNVSHTSVGVEMDLECILAYVVVLGRMISWWGQARTLRQWLSYNDTDLTGNESGKELLALLVTRLGAVVWSPLKDLLICDLSSLQNALESAPDMDTEISRAVRMDHKWRRLPGISWSRLDLENEYYEDEDVQNPHPKPKPSPEPIVKPPTKAAVQTIPAHVVQQAKQQAQQHMPQHAQAWTADASWEAWQVPPAAPQNDTIGQGLLNMLEQLGGSTPGFELDHIASDPSRIREFLQAQPEIHAQLVLCLAQTTGADLGLP